MRIIRAAVLAASLLVFVAPAALAEGETVQVLHVDCDAVTVRGGGYTAGQDLTVVVRGAQALPGADGITDMMTVKANGDGQLPTTTLKIGGPVPDGAYRAVVSTPIPPGGQAEEVTRRFEITGCGAGLDSDPNESLPFTGPRETLLVLAVAFVVIGGGLWFLTRRTHAR